MLMELNAMFNTFFLFFQVLLIWGYIICFFPPLSLVFAKQIVDIKKIVMDLVIFFT